MPYTELSAAIDICLPFSLTTTQHSRIKPLAPSASPARALRETTPNLQESAQPVTTGRK
jgi:hypothetical protein